MKMLQPGPLIVIPSNSPRTRQGPDSRGIRICVAQIGRSCVLDQGYVTFTDGSAYVYGAPSKDEFEDLCASVQRGRQFNFQVRRSRAGYVRGFTPPADYEIIYSFPPYPGSQPPACNVCGGMNTDFNAEVWSVDPAGNPATIAGAGVSFAITMQPGAGNDWFFDGSGLCFPNPATTFNVHVDNSGFFFLDVTELFGFLVPSPNMSPGTSQDFPVPISTGPVTDRIHLHASPLCNNVVTFTITPPP